MLNFKIVETEEFKTCLDIRTKVFIEEQKVPVELEIDDLESIADHFLVFSDEKPVGTARLIKINDNTAKIGRVAVLKEYRGKDIGKFLMEEIIEYARNLGITTILLSSQTYAIGFYEKFGFKAFGKEFMDADIPHYMMRVDFEK